MSNTGPPLLEIENLSISYSTNDGKIHAVNDVSFSIQQGEFFGLVGESGSGKSTIAKAIIGGLDPNAEIESGKIILNNTEIQDLTESELNEIRWKEISLIPQSSMNSLDPIMKVSTQAAKIGKAHMGWSKTEALNRLRELFEIVGLPQDRIHSYPGEFSGGMQQRAIIALSLLLEPSLIVADEPTTALDVILQDNIIKHINDIKKQDISILFITHDVSVIFENCDSLAVLHGGQVAELGSTTEIYDNPKHPYSILLQQAFPDIRFFGRELAEIKGDPPKLDEKVDFCTFRNRCPYEIEKCSDGPPPLEDVDDGDHKSSCVRADEIPEII